MNCDREKGPFTKQYKGPLSHSYNRSLKRFEKTYPKRHKRDGTNMWALKIYYKLDLTLTV